MARVPYDPVPDVAAQGVPDDYLRVQTDPGQFGGLIGTAEQKAGGALEEAGSTAANVALQFQQMNNETVTNEGLQKWGNALGDAEYGLYQQKGSNAVNAFASFKSKLTGQMNDIANSIPSPMARLAFQREAVGNLERTMRSAGSYVAGQAESANVASYEGKIATIRNLAALHANDPSQIPDFVQQTTDASLAIAQAKGFDAGAAHAMVASNVSDMIGNIIDVTMNQGSTVPEQQAALARANALFQQFQDASIPGSPGVPMLDAKHQDQLGQKLRYQGMLLDSKADRAVDAAAAHARVGLDQTYSAAGAIVDSGQSATSVLTHISDAQIDAAFPKEPDRAAVLKEQVNDLRQVSSYLDRFAGATPDQMQAIIASAPQPDPNDPATYRSREQTIRALSTALSRVNKALSTDPAGYVLGSHPEIAALSQAAERDPAKFDTYAQAALGVQAQMGVPETARAVLPAAYTKAAVAQIEQADPATAYTRLQSVQKMAGDYWPQVYGELVRNKLPATYQAALVASPQDGQTIIAALQANGDKEFREVLPKKTTADIATALDQDTGLGQLRDSMSAAGRGGLDVFTATRNAVETTAMYLAARQGLSADDAVTRAAGMVTGRFDFMAQGTNPAARLPKGTLADVQAATQERLGALQLGDVQGYQDITAEGTAQQNREAALEGARRAWWLTLPSADGLGTLRAIDPYNGQPVLLSGNRPLDIPIASTRGAAARNALPGEPPGEVIPAMGGL